MIHESTENSQYRSIQQRQECLVFSYTKTSIVCSVGVFCVYTGGFSYPFPSFLTKKKQNESGTSPYSMKLYAIGNARPELSDVHKLIEYYDKTTGDRVSSPKFSEPLMGHRTSAERQGSNQLNYLHAFKFSF